MSSGYFKYMSEESSSSLYRNGMVFTKRDINGNDGGSKGINLKKYEMHVENARNYEGEEKLNLDKNGFELLKSKLGKSEKDFFNNSYVLTSYYTHCANLVKNLTNASHVSAFDHNIRSATGKKKKKRIAGGQQVQGPAHVVHGDYTLTSAPARLKQLAQPPRENDTIAEILDPNDALLPRKIIDKVESGGRFSIINVWRNIVAEPVESNPIALCDAATVSSDDLVVFEIHYSDRVGENYFAKHNNNHRWYFYPKLTIDEVLLIKQWDSDGMLAYSDGTQSDFNSGTRPCTFSFHAAFDDKNTRSDAPDRWSMEVRCIVVY